jgi:hypothetical protein
LDIQGGTLKSSLYHSPIGDAGSALPHIQTLLNTFHAVHCHGLEFILLNDCYFCFKNMFTVLTLRLNKTLHGCGLLLGAPLYIIIALLVLLWPSFFTYFSLLCITVNIIIEDLAAERG